MDPERWQRVRSIFQQAMQAEAEVRRSLIEERCSGDDAMLAAVEALIMAHAGEPRLAMTESRGSEAPTVISMETHDLGPDLPPGMRIDSFVIRDKIGEGAFGVVYAAEQTGTIKRKKVALKIVKAALDAAQILARFDAERQALALMSHENIAKILAAGEAPGGRPYFAMEHVPGIPITAHCDRYRLGIDKRLELFVQVCRAVHHAHQKGVLHRDLKPSNILVAYEDGKATPKIIDFGVAKALDRPLTDQAIFTRYGQMIGTPAYMSPEQAEGSCQDVDTRSDIYSLGVLLYELLVGALPFDPEMLRSIGYQEMLRVIREVEPAKPSTKLSTQSGSESTDSSEAADRRGLKPHSLTRLLRGDLDWITLRCLEKDRSRRYQAASDLAADIGRHIDHVPVQAGPPSVSYRAGKFIRRHRFGVAAAGAVLALILGGAIGGTYLEVKRSQEQRRRAEVQAELDRHRSRDLLESARSTVYEFYGEARQLADDALELNPSFVDAKIFRAYALLFEQGRDAAITAARGVVHDHPGSAEAAVLLASLLRPANPDEAERIEKPVAGQLRPDRLFYYRALGAENGEEALRLLDRSLAANPWYFDAKWQQAMQRYSLFRHEEMLQDARLLASVRPELARPWTLEGVALASLGRLEAAAVSFDRAVERAPDLWLGYYNRGWLLLQQGDDDAALAELKRALSLSPDNPDVLGQIGAIHARAKRWTEVIQVLDDAISQKPDGLMLRDRGTAHRYIGSHQRAVDDFTSALDYSWESDEGRAWIYNYRGLALQRLGRYEESRQDFEQAIGLEPRRAIFHYNLGYMWMAQGIYEESLPHFEEAIHMEPAGMWTFGRGLANWFLGQLDDALRDLEPLSRLNKNESMYAWLWEIHMTRGDVSLAAETLVTAERQSDDPYTRAMVGYLREELDSGEYLAAMQDDAQRISAMFTIGSAARVRGKTDEARSWFARALELGQFNMLEHDLSALRLAELDG